MDARLARGSFSLGNKTDTAGTAFYGAIPPRAGSYTRVLRCTYTSGATPHALQFLLAQGKTVTTAATSSGGTTLTLSSVTLAKDAAFADEDLAANDFVVVQHVDGTWGAYKISSISGKVITINALAKAVANGAVVYGMYEISRTAHKEAVQLRTVASVTHVFETMDPAGGIASSHGTNEPLMYYSDNTANAGFINQLTAVYSRV